MKSAYRNFLFEVHVYSGYEEIDKPSVGALEGTIECSKVVIKIIQQAIITLNLDTALFQACQLSSAEDISADYKSNTYWRLWVNDFNQRNKNNRNTDRYEINM